MELPFGVRQELKPKILASHISPYHLPILSEYLTKMFPDKRVVAAQLLKCKTLTAVRKHLAEVRGIVLTPAQDTQLGEVYREVHSTITITHYEFDKELRWKSGDFGDWGSCFFAYPQADFEGNPESPWAICGPPTIRRCKIYAMKFFNGEKGIGRCFIHFNEKFQCWTLFNTKGIEHLTAVFIFGRWVQYPFTIYRINSQRWEEEPKMYTDCDDIMFVRDGADIPPKGQHDRFPSLITNNFITKDGEVRNPIWNYY